MDGLDAGVLEAPVEEVEEGLGEVEESLEPEAVAEPVEGEAEQQEAKDDPYTTKFSREMRAATKAWEQANPEMARFAKQARDNHARLFALNQLEPKGLDGIRENYALLQAIGGSEGLTGLQERIAGVETVDALLAAGDPKAFDELGPDFAEGLAKLAPAYLERVASTNPEAFEAAILPHVVSTLTKSPVLEQFNYLVDVLNGKYGKLDDATKLERTLDALRQMSDGFNALGQKAGEFKAAPVDKQRTEFEAERTKFEQEKQEAHWNTNIRPQVTQHETAKFEELLKPYQVRLKLDTSAKEDLKQAFKAALNKAAAADQDYLRQMKIYRAQKNPDPAAVTNYVKNAINKHSKTAMEALVKARYGAFLAGKQKAAVVTRPGGKPQGPVAPNIEIRTVKPPMNEINHRASHPLEMAQGIYTLNNGKKIQVVRQRA